MLLIPLHLSLDRQDLLPELIHPVDVCRALLSQRRQGCEQQRLLEAQRAQVCGDEGDAELGAAQEGLNLGLGRCEVDFGGDCGGGGGGGGGGGHSVCMGFGGIQGSWDVWLKVESVGGRRGTRQCR